MAQNQTTNRPIRPGLIITLFRLLFQTVQGIAFIFFLVFLVFHLVNWASLQAGKVIRTEKVHFNNIAKGH